MFRRHVAERADDGRAAALPRRIEHAAEIDQRDFTVGRAQQVRRLDVAMHHDRRSRVQVIDDLERADQHVAQLELREPPPLREFAEVLAGQALHHEVERAGRLLEVREVARDAGVPELRQHLRFALEQLERLPRPPRSQPFDDDQAVLIRRITQALVPGEKNLALCACA
jgi:hypothetical protein